MSEVFYSLQQASDLTGCSLGRFRYNREKLLGLGVQISPDGWRVPHSALVSLGWLGKEQPAKVRLTALQRAELRIAELEEENTRLLTELSSRRKSFFRR
jgi:hypothetical protein